MAPPSKISQLPQELRDQLNQRIISNGFADYDGLELWLTEQLGALGLTVSISRAAIHREGKKLERLGERVKAMKMMQAGWDKQMGNKGIGELGRVLNAQLQGLAFTLTQDAVDGEVSVDAEFLKDMSVTIMRLEKAAAINEERDSKIRTEERALAREAAARTVEKSARQSGVSEDTIAAIRRDVLGMA